MLKIYFVIFKSYSFSLLKIVEHHFSSGSISNTEMQTCYAMPPEIVSEYFVKILFRLEMEARVQIKTNPGKGCPFHNVGAQTYVYRKSIATNRFGRSYSNIIRARSHINYARNLVSQRGRGITWLRIFLPFSESELILFLKSLRHVSDFLNLSGISEMHILSHSLTAEKIVWGMNTISIRKDRSEWMLKSLRFSYIDNQNFWYAIVLSPW